MFHDASHDVAHMRRAINLAMRGRGAVEPNPMVGCVIVKNGGVIGEGHHRRFGGPHAEPEALAACRASPAEGTAYVTLEPCCHADKKTPPCVPALIEAGLARVVIGCLDPNPAVSGGGAEQLKRAGLEVAVGVLEAEAKQLNAAFFARMLHRRPYVTLKWAQSADGKVAGPGGQRVQISNECSQRVVHELRARCDGILVGINTVLHDDPLLTPRGVADSRPLIRYVLDRRLRIPLHSRLVRTASEAKVVIACAPEAIDRQGERIEQLGRQGVEVIAAASTAQVLTDAYGRGLTHLLLESGPTLAAAMFGKGLADRLWLIRSPTRIDDPTAPLAASVPAELITTGTADLDGDELIEYLNPSSSVYFAPAASTDLAMARGMER